MGDFKARLYHCLVCKEVVTIVDYTPLRNDGSVVRAKTHPQTMHKDFLDRHFRDNDWPADGEPSKSAAQYYAASLMGDAISAADPTTERAKCEFCDQTKRLKEFAGYPGLLQSICRKCSDEEEELYQKWLDQNNQKGE